jgi:nucleoside-diphosphate-sugar epimerase
VTTSRDFTFVEDTARGLAAIAGLDHGLGEVFQIGSNNEITIRDLFHTITDVMGISATIAQEEQRLRPAGSEVLRLRCDNTKLAQASGFLPSIALREGLRRTAEWFTQEQNRKRYKEYLYNV